MATKAEHDHEAESSAVEAGPAQAQYMTDEEFIRTARRVAEKRAELLARLAQ